MDRTEQAKGRLVLVKAGAVGQHAAAGHADRIADCGAGHLAVSGAEAAVPDSAIVSRSRPVGPDICRREGGAPRLGRGGATTSWARKG
jgi:hypothetical protein